MSRRMSKWIWSGIGALVAVGVVVAVLIIRNVQYDNAPCITVNGVMLTNREIDLAYEQQSDGMVRYSRDEVITATVRNMVVRDYGRGLGITVTEAELDDIIAGYKETGYYDSAVAIYGEDGLRQGLHNHKLFERTKEYILTNDVAYSDVTEEDIQAFLKKNGLENMNLTDTQREDVLSTLAENKKETAYNAFVDELLKKATVVYGE